MSSSQVEQPLSEPFSQIFESRETAEWAFELIGETLRMLGVRQPEDERYVLSLSADESRLRLNFGKWAVLGFRSAGQSGHTQVEMSLIRERARPARIAEAPAYVYKNSDPPVGVYQALDASRVRSWPGELRQAYEETMAYVSARFGNWRRANFRNAHLPALAVAVFDPQVRQQLFSTGIPEDELVDDQDDQDEEQTEQAEHTFSRQTFALLKGLHEDPHKTFYDAHKEELSAFVIRPLQALLRSVARELPWQLTAVLETRRRLFGRILKNDWGRGGAWDYYWGAFSAKGTSRQRSPQLLVRIDRDGLHYGFALGSKARAARERLLRNAARYAGELMAVPGFRESLASLQDARISASSLEAWLSDPAVHNMRFLVDRSPDQVQQASTQELARKIGEVFLCLYPVFQLSAQDDPLPNIRSFLERSAVLAPAVNPPFSLSELAAQVLLPAERLTDWLRAIENKGQAIFYGPPGTGKTYLSERIARHLIAGGDGFSELIQFHPSYAYEDFVSGLRPAEQPDQAMFIQTPGRFLDFCQRAATRTGRCVLIIDEINRADLSRVFGELMFALEYRQRSVMLASGEAFQVPANVRIIGTMNTADRSIALVDFALRRRFAFLSVPPDYEQLDLYHARRQTGFPVENLVAVLRRINTALEEPNFWIGQATFLRPDLSEVLATIWRSEIEPYLEEYFFDRPDTVDAFRWQRIGPSIQRTTSAADA